MSREDRSYGPCVHALMRASAGDTRVWTVEQKGAKRGKRTSGKVEGTAECIDSGERSECNAPQCSAPRGQRSRARALSQSAWRGRCVRWPGEVVGHPRQPQPQVGSRGPAWPHAPLEWHVAEA